MITYQEGNWIATEPIKSGTSVIAEVPILECPGHVPSEWKKLAKKIAKLEPDRKPEDVAETMPPWSTVSLNEAIIRLLYAFDVSKDEIKKTVLSIYDPLDESKDSPFESLIKKAKQIISKVCSSLNRKYLKTHQI